MRLTISLLPLIARHRFAATAAGLYGLLVLGCNPSAQAAQFSIGELMAALAAGTYGVAAFTEKKYISILDLPVDSSGELVFSPPGRLEKRTLTPRVETLVLDGDTLTIVREAHKHVMQLKDYPEVAGMILGIRATLAGDRKALESAYRLDLEGTRDRWSLVLTPLDPRVAFVIARIRMEGTQDEVRTVEILLADGDRSVMNIRKSTWR